MGIGIWYEMYISDPVAFLFKNTDPRGSLRANVSNATVRCLSNMRLGDMLETRHTMSQAVRAEVSDKSHDWGYRLGSGLHPQGALPRRGHDPADRGEGRQPAAAGDVGDPAGRREPGEHHHQHRRAKGGGRVREGGGDAAADRRRRRSTGSARIPRSRRRSSRCSRIRNCSRARPGSRSSRAAATCSPKCSRWQPRAGGATLQPPRAERRPQSFVLHPGRQRQGIVWSPSVR